MFFKFYIYQYSIRGFIPQALCFPIYGAEQIKEFIYARYTPRGSIESVQKERLLT